MGVKSKDAAKHFIDDESGALLDVLYVYTHAVVSFGKAACCWAPGRFLSFYLSVFLSFLRLDVRQRYVRITLNPGRYELALKVSGDVKVREDAHRAAT